MVIGAKGRQINQLKDDTRADIIVNQPIVEMNKRSVAKIHMILFKTFVATFFWAYSVLSWGSRHNKRFALQV